MATSVGRFYQAQAEGVLLAVPMDSVRFLEFRKNPVRLSCLGTESLNGCSAVIIVSVSGAILAHIPPRPNSDMSDPLAGDRNVQQKMEDIANLYLRFACHFTSKMDNWVFSAVYENEIALQDQRVIIERNLQSMGLAYTRLVYNVLAVDETRFPGQGTVLIDGTGPTPKVYVEDKLVSP